MQTNLSGLLIFAAVAVFLIGIIIYARWWHVHGGGKRQREQAERRKRERETGVGARGWQYDGTIDGNIHYRISGLSVDGLPWQIQYDSDQSSSSSTPKLIFAAKTAGNGQYQWLIHDKKTYGWMQKSGARAVFGGIGKLVGAFSDAMRLRTDFYLKISTLSAGSRDFRERYVLAAIDPKWVSLITHEIERLILTWPEFKQTMSSRDNCFSAELTPDGLKIQLFADAPEMAVIDHMARLGQRVLEEMVRIDLAR